MVRVRKPQLTLETLLFSTPEQKVLRFLLSEPTTVFTPRVISSKLKGVRGLGGVDGINSILSALQELGLVDFVDNNRAIRLRDDNPIAQKLKVTSAICDLEGLKASLEPVTSKGVLFGSRAEGKAPSDGEYDLFVVTANKEEATRIAQQHPLGKVIRLTARTQEECDDLTHNEKDLANQLDEGIVLWGASW
jgi:hypothetical protein